ncbi:MAG TPA: urate hydroxylase PuuD [Anaeromyxobacteraceae bacterium]|nr:urate hydroxylase PuuD [Anaeromyxobacteraceae bacterium]
MDPFLGTRGPSLLHVIHVAAGILWMGCVLMWSSICARLAGDPAGKELEPRRTSEEPSLFRWAAATTWVTGMVLTVLVYYGARGPLVRREVRLEAQHGLTVDFVRATEESVIGHAAGVVLSLAVIALSFLAYGAARKLLRAHARVAAAGSYLLLVLVLHVLSRFFTGRAVLMHAGAVLGTAMAVNAWTRRRLTRADLVRRSRHDLYMCVPALLAMVATQDAAIHDRRDGWVIMALVVGASWAATAWALRCGRAASATAASRSP